MRAEVNYLPGRERGRDGRAEPRAEGEAPQRRHRGAFGRGGPGWRWGEGLGALPRSPAGWGGLQCGARPWARSSAAPRAPQRGPPESNPADSGSPLLRGRASALRSPSLLSNLSSKLAFPFPFVFFIYMCIYIIYIFLNYPREPELLLVLLCLWGGGGGLEGRRAVKRFGSDRGHLSLNSPRPALRSWRSETSPTGQW